MTSIFTKEDFKLIKSNKLPAHPKIKELKEKMNELGKELVKRLEDEHGNFKLDIGGTYPPASPVSYLRLSLTKKDGQRYQNWPQLNVELNSSDAGFCVFVDLEACERFKNKPDHYSESKNFCDNLKRILEDQKGRTYFLKLLHGLPAEDYFQMWPWPEKEEVKDVEFDDLEKIKGGIDENGFGLRTSYLKDFVLKTDKDELLGSVIEDFEKLYPFFDICMGSYKTQNSRADSEELENLLLSKNQIILYGPPGTGKTYEARKFAIEFILKQNDGGK